MYSAAIPLRRLTLLAGLAVLISLPALSASAQTVAPPKVSVPAGDTNTEEKTESEAPPTPQQYYETVTVSTTLNPATLMEAPGTVSVVDSATLERRLIQNTADLVKFEPGVYVDANITRVGLNGFNIRGIGGNRVMTQVDGVETSEQFDFGPFNVHQFTLDLDTLKSAEIMRSSGSAIYGSDALGGVVSFFTKDPADYLASRRFHAGGKMLYDSRASDTSGNLVVAGGSRRVLASLFASYAYGHELHNQGEIDTQNATRTLLNPQDRKTSQVLGKLAFPISDGNLLRAAVELNDSNIFTNAFSQRTSAVPGITSDDTMSRQRVSVDQSIVNLFGLTQFSWNGYIQQSDTDQVIDEVRAAAGPTPAVYRSGTLAYSQNTYGGTLQGRQAVMLANQQSMLFTFGGAHKHHTFDMLRDRVDINQVTGAVVPTTALILPSKYFPKSEVGESGAYVQSEMRFGRLLLVPGLRYDRFTMDADDTDQVYLATLSPAPVDFSADALSTKLGASFRLSNAMALHAQFAEGFRAPPYSAINSGFTNLLGGYTSVPNTDLDPETSSNFEAGIRTSFSRVSFGVTGFINHYDNFIDQVLRGTNPTTRLLEYQYQNIAAVRIRGVELRGDAALTRTLRLRGSYAAISGDNTSGDTDVPLNSIAPNQGIVGLAYAPASNRWGSELTVRATRGQSPATAGTGFYVPESCVVTDLTGYVTLAPALTLRGGVLNLTDAKYFEWTNVRGRQATDPAIDRYSSPGISGLVSIAYGW